MENIAEVRSTLKQLLSEGIDLVIMQLERSMNAESPYYNVYIQLKSRYSLYLKEMMLGTISSKEQDISYSTLSNGLLLLIDSLQENDFERIPYEINSRTSFGQLLYYIPPDMTVNYEHKCIIRIAKDNISLYDSWNVNEADQKEKIRVSDIMSVELLNMGSSNKFEITPLHGEPLQFLDDNDKTDWVFLVKPLASGNHLLLLRIAAIEVINGREVQKKVVLENLINVSLNQSEKPANFFSFIKTNLKIKIEKKGYWEPESKGLWDHSKVRKRDFRFIPTNEWKQQPDQYDLESYFHCLKEGMDNYPEHARVVKEKNDETTREINRIEAEREKEVKEMLQKLHEQHKIEKERLKDKYLAERAMRPRRSGLEMQYIPGGAFQMKTKDLIVDVKSFFIGKFIVTQKDWSEIMHFNPSFFNDEDYYENPVENVSLHQIHDFLTQLNMLFPDKNFRLPTEVEWEYAASGGLLSKGYKYPGSNHLGEIAWCKENSSQKTEPVGYKMPNELGLYDMAGNVWEWCKDEDGYVLRGGAYYYDELNFRLDTRYKASLTMCNKYIGFRLAYSETV